MQWALGCLLALSTCEILVHTASGSYYFVALLLILDCFLTFLLLKCRRKQILPAIFVISCSIIVLSAAPYLLLPSISLLISFICYTLLPLQLLHTLIAALILSLATIIVHTVHIVVFNVDQVCNLLNFFLFFYKFLQVFFSLALPVVYFCANHSK